jgi:small subunit ribosomal protein S1
VGKVLPGTVDRKETFGLLISLEPGVVALLPKGSYRDLTENPFEHAKVGDQVTVQVAEINFEERKMRLQPPKDGDDGTWQEFAGQSKSFGNSFADQLKGFNIKK